MFFINEDMPTYDDPRWSLTAETMFFDVTVRNASIEDLKDLHKQLGEVITKHYEKKAESEGVKDDG